jgi:hypothetical protein
MEAQQSQPVRFRFLSNEEFFGLPQAERIYYLECAMAALRRGNAAEVTSSKEKHWLSS